MEAPNLKPLLYIIAALSIITVYIIWDLRLSQNEMNRYVKSDIEKTLFYYCKNGVNITNQDKRWRVICLPLDTK